jgi:membrane protease YdiL (CAAX protease family)
VEASSTRPNRRRLVAWTTLITLYAVLAYSQRGSHSSQSIYTYSLFAGGLLTYALWLGLVALICVNRVDLFAFRRPADWRNALKLAALAAVFIVVIDVVVPLLPLPQTPGQEQSMTPTRWEPAHAGALAANFVLIAVVAPFAEELIFRGAGQSLLRIFGRIPSIVLVGLAFGADHGLLEGLLVLVPFGMALAWLRDRTESTFPGMLVHALFNGAALALIVVS